MASPIDQQVIRDLNGSILQAAEINNRIKKVQQIERSPLIDNYSSINEPHAHPFGLMSGFGPGGAVQQGIDYESSLSNPMTISLPMDSIQEGP
jgi:hypothetical protein